MAETVDGAATAAVRLAATVVLLRDSAAGPEVLLLERPHHRGSFAGAWVFPGGSVDAEDWPAGHPDAGVDQEVAARRAAVRELQEETALLVAGEDLLLTAKWTPPVIAPRRFVTWFYLAAAPAGEIVLSAEESVDHAWIRPEAALERHAAGGLVLVPPTWVTLYGLIGARSTAAALDRARRNEWTDYATRIVAAKAGRVMLWHGDIAYEDDGLFDAEGGRHRLDTRALPWVYSKS